MSKIKIMRLFDEGLHRALILKTQNTKDFGGYSLLIKTSGEFHAGNMTSN